MTRLNSRELLNKVNAIESLLIENARILRESLSISKEQQFIMNHGIEGCKKRILDEFKLKEKTSAKDKLLSVFRNDLTLRHPHRKILDFLIEQHDYQQKKFHEVHFSKIVKECKLGKNKAREYLEFLKEKGYIECRTDGYRKFYVVRDFNY